MAKVLCQVRSCNRLGEEVIVGLRLCDMHMNELVEFQRNSLFTPFGRSVVYYVSWPAVSQVKIGTTTNIRLRLKALNRASKPARLLAAEPGHYYLEKRRHREFSSSALGGELFTWTPRLAEHIAGIRETTGWVPNRTVNGL